MHRDSSGADARAVHRYCAQDTGGGIEMPRVVAADRIDLRH